MTATQTKSTILDFSQLSLPNSVTVRDKTIGSGHPTFIIAEIGNNHNGSMELAKRLIETAAKAGADAVKFQKRILYHVFNRELLDTPQTQSTSLGKTYEDYRHSIEFTPQQLAELRDFSHSWRLVFFVTPFDLKSAKYLGEVGMDCWKIASFDVTHHELLEYVAKMHQPIFLSTGTATLEECDEAVAAILKYNTQLVIKHCVSIYPTPDDDLNLGAILTFKERYKPLPIGYSGHELGFIPTIAAVTLGACSVERHFTMDKTLPGPDHSTVSLDPAEFTEMVKQIRRIEKAISDTNVYLHQREIPTRNKHGKSIVAKRKIKMGTLITADMLVCKSPGYGIKPSLMSTVVGKKAKVMIPEDAVIMESHLQ